MRAVRLRWPRIRDAGDMKEREVDPVSETSGSIAEIEKVFIIGRLGAGSVQQTVIGVE